MSEQQNINYNRIAEAIEFLAANFKQQPSLDELAEQVHLSSFHLQRLFTDWAGVSPKKFLQFLTVDYAKKLLQNRSSSLLDVAFESGLSGTGRLHDLFINIEGMTPGEFKNGGAELSLNYSYAETAFGKILVASTSKGICHMGFADDEQSAFNDLHAKFPNASYNQVVDLFNKMHCSSSRMTGAG